MRGSRRGSGFGRAGLVTGALLLAALAGMPSGTSAAPDAARAVPAPQVQDPRLTGGLGPALLLPVRYPLEASGHPARGTVRLTLPGRFSVVRTFAGRLHAGLLRQGDRRKTFRFVHRVGLPARLARQIKRRPGALRSSVSIQSTSPALQTWRFRSTGVGVRAAGPGFCTSVPLQLVTAGRPVSARLPDCGTRAARWKVRKAPRLASVSVSNRTGRFRYAPRKNRFGEDSFTIVAKRKGRTVAVRTIHVRVSATAASDTSVVAFGDSVTAGFGYFGANGRQMSITQLLKCRPGDTFLNDACSSNAYNRNSSLGTSPDYLPDYGLSRNVSWAAQWANQYGLTDYRNYAVTGSAPSDWLPKGQFSSTFDSIKEQNPDYILLTMGANPLLSDVLFGIDNMGCALESDLFGDFSECVMKAFAEVDLSSNLNQLYSALVTGTTSRIVVMQYHLSIPASALAYTSAQIEQMGNLLNEVILNEAGAVSPERITVVSPPRFDVGIDMSPLYPSRFSCSFLGYEVDGPSVQATVSQDELELAHPLSFCPGPAVGPPWVISGDTGIHPSATGYSRMASQVPAPGS